MSIALAWTQWVRGQAQAAQVHSDEAQQAYEGWLALGKDPSREWAFMSADTSHAAALGLALMAQAVALRDAGKMALAIEVLR